MFDDTARNLLRRPLLARMSTIDMDGYPHTVPVWFMLDNNDIVIISTRDTCKVGYIAANPKGALVVGGDSGDGGGYLIKGEFSVEEDPDRYWMKKLTYHYEDREQAEKDIAAWMDLDMIVIRMKPKRVSKVA